MDRLHHKTRAYIASLIEARPVDRPFFVMLPDLPAEPPRLRGGTKKAAESAIMARREYRPYRPSKAVLRKQEEQAKRAADFEHLLSKLPPAPTPAPIVAAPEKQPARKDRLRRGRERFIDIRILVDAQRRHCAICGEIMTWPGVRSPDDPTSRPTIDHVVPISKGGGNWRNIVAAHSRCNGKKADRMPTGCERIWLAVVNGKLFSQEGGYG